MSWTFPDAIDVATKAAQRTGRKYRVASCRCPLYRRRPHWVVSPTERLAGVRAGEVTC